MWPDDDREAGNACMGLGQHASCNVAAYKRRDKQFSEVHKVT